MADMAKHDDEQKEMCTAAYTAAAATASRDVYLITSNAHKVLWLEA
jgi:hypothetical protein